MQVLVALFQAAVLSGCKAAASPLGVTRRLAGYIILPNKFTFIL